MYSKMDRRGKRGGWIKPSLHSRPRNRQGFVGGLSRGPPVPLGALVFVVVVTMGTAAAGFQRRGPVDRPDHPRDQHLVPLPKSHTKTSTSPPSP